MNVLIAGIIKQQLLSLPYFDRGAGLVQTITKEDSSLTTGKILRFPVEVNLLEKNLVPCIPDDGIKGMFYLEDGGTKPNDINDFTSDLTLVCWLNPKKISADVDSVSVNAIADILNALKPYLNEAPITKLKITPTSIPIRSADIFAKYSYSETETQFLMPPFDFFAIKLKASFRLAKSCLNPLTPAEPC